MKVPPLDQRALTKLDSATPGAGTVPAQAGTPPPVVALRNKPAATPAAVDGASSQVLRDHTSTASAPVGRGGTSAVHAPSHTRFLDATFLGPNVRSLAEGKPSPTTMAALGALITRLPGALKSTLEGKLQHLQENQLPPDMSGDVEEVRMREWRHPENQLRMSASQLVGAASFLRGVAASLEKGGDALADGALQKLAREAGAQSAAAIGPRRQAWLANRAAHRPLRRR